MIDGSILRAGLKVLAHALNPIAAEPHMICFWLNSRTRIKPPSEVTRAPWNSTRREPLNES